MAHKVKRLPRADDDLWELWAHIAVERPKAADRLVARFYAAEDLLSDFPQLGEARPDLAPDLRKWTVDPYLMLYRITHEAIEIVRILHGAQDLAAVLGELPLDSGDD
ncbi:MAG TPA: type II toxin-antitoxin system RelE/ParE family toxin [Caulobacteraceae bacterium]|nr:type II toxin-antitoxin system RelE/ParE family toxin [Caulobacteraceae bacterium]